MSKMLDCLQCTKTAKERRQAFDKIVALAQQQAKAEGVRKYVCKRSSTGDFFIAEDAARARRYPVVEVVEPA